MPRSDSYLLLLLGIVALMLPVGLSNPYYLHVLILSYLYVLLTVSYDIHVGHLGLFSFGQAAFFGTGLYTAAICATQLEISFWASLPLSALAGAVVACIMGLIIVNLSVFSFKIASIAFYMIVYLVITNWIGLTGGPMGIKGIPSPTVSIPMLGVYSISSKLAYYYLIFGFTAVSLWLIHLLLGSRIGKAFHAIREDEIRAQAIGIDTLKYKMIGLTASGLFAGLAGGLWAYYVRIAHPDALGAGLFTTLLVMIIVGGLGRPAGIAIVAIALTLVPELLRVSGELRQIFYGLLLLGTILYIPEGLGGRLQSLFAGRHRKT